MSNVPSKVSENQVSKEMAEMKAKLAEAEAKLAEMTRAQEEGANQKSVRKSEQVVRGEGYTFEVGPRSETAGCPKKTIVCCDESEAIRWYVATTEDPIRKGKQIDPVKIPITAKCVDASRRAEEVKKQKRLAYIRSKVEVGSSLTDDESEEWEEANGFQKAS